MSLIGAFKDTVSECVLDNELCPHVQVTLIATHSHNRWRSCTSWGFSVFFVRKTDSLKKQKSITPLKYISQGQVLTTDQREKRFSLKQAAQMQLGKFNLIYMSVTEWWTRSQSFHFTTCFIWLLFLPTLGRPSPPLPPKRERNWPWPTASLAHGAAAGMSWIRGPNAYSAVAVTRRVRGPTGCSALATELIRTAWWGAAAQQTWPETQGWLGRWLNRPVAHPARQPPAWAWQVQTVWRPPERLGGLLFPSCSRGTPVSRNQPKLPDFVTAASSAWTGLAVVPPGSEAPPPSSSL